MNFSLKNYVVRPYFAHDCSSWDGFNNGYHLDGIKVEAINEIEACEKALIEYCNEFNIDTAKNDLGFDDFFISNIKTYCGPQGEEITEKEYMEAIDSDLENSEDYGYLYEYIDFNRVEIIKGE